MNEVECKTDLVDLTNFNRYQKENLLLKKKPISDKRVVFMGNSITDAWVGVRPNFFAGKDWIGRGISGQTTSQMLMRFQEDVVNLNPKFVVILAGTNDIAGNTGEITLKRIANNISMMVDIAQANQIKVYVCSVLPVYQYPWAMEIGVVANKIIELNTLLKKLSNQKSCIYVDYHSQMKNMQGGLSKELAEDGVHPTQKGYEIMEQILLKYQDFQ